MMINKKIAVHVTNEEQWNEVKDYYGFHWVNVDDQESDIFIRIDTDGSLSCANDGWALDKIGYSILEFNEWQACIKEDSMEKIELPQAVYDEFNMLNGARSTAFSVFTDVWSRDIQDDIWEYIFGSGNKTKQHQLNLAKVMAGEAEFVPVEEAYYWRDKQEKWLGYTDSNVSTIELFGDFDLRTKITETEIREKTSFDIDKLKRVSE